MSEENTPLEVGPAGRSILVYALVSGNEVSVSQVSTVKNREFMDEYLQIYPNSTKDYLIMKLHAESLVNCDIRAELFEVSGQELLDTGKRVMTETGLKMDLQTTCGELVFHNMIIVSE